MPTPSTAATARRPDVEGLRAVASLLVAIYHVWPGRVSGGVDVFFVITGFLVVPPLVDALRRSGARAAGRAIVRTVLRQLPMSGLVLAVVAVAVAILWPPHLRSRLMLDVLAAATWWENWLLVDRSTTYLAGGATASPVQHFWATSVHVQVVVVLVVLLLASTLVARRIGVRALPVVALATVTALSFAWAVLHAHADPDAAYFDTGARLWELGVGALAGILGVRMRAGRGARAALGVTGSALVLAAGPLSSLGPQPGVVTLVPVAGATALLLAGAGAGAGGTGDEDGRPVGVARLLAWGPLVALGRLSWGLYLWCWPVLVGYRLLAPERAATAPIMDGIAIVAAAALLSWLSRELLSAIERIRWHPSRLALPAVVGATLVALATSGAAPPPEPRVAPIASAEAAQSAIDATIAGGDFTGVQWLGSQSQAPEWVVDDCLDVDAERAARCTYGPADAALDVAVVGDSHAVSWMPAIRAGLPDARVRVLTRGLCAFSTVTYAVPDADRQECVDHVDWVTGRLLADPPDVVVVANGLRDPALVQDDDGLVAPEHGIDAVAAGTAARLGALQDAGIPVLWLDTPPPFHDVASCAVPFAVESALARCTSSAAGSADARVAAFSAAAASEPLVTFVDVRPWLCSSTSGLCSATIDGMLVTADGTHLSWMLSAALGDLVAERVVAVTATA